ncbi:MAG: C45 family autoproteolytic acyltransferase/hydrolase [Candidatus Heimdallarchaeota archaeon]
MHHINLNGTYYEMGVFYGKILKESGFKLPTFSNKEIQFALRCKDHVETVFPGYVEEIRGIADTAKLQFEGLCAMTLKIPNSIPNCSILAVTDGEQTFLGRNYDMYYSFKEEGLAESYFTDPYNGFKSVGHTDIFVGREDGVNEKGLGVAMSGITAYFEPGIAFWVAIRYLLDNCATVQEGINFLTDIPHYCTMTFLLADPTGDMVVIEASPKQIAVRKPKNDYIVSTNHLNHPKMQTIEMYEPPDSRIRYETIIKAL